MKTILALGLSVLLVAACGDTVTSPEMSDPDGPLFAAGASGFPNVTGGGWTEFDEPPVKAHIGFTAKLHKAGYVKGQLQYTVPAYEDFIYHGVVDCLAVEGNRAWFSGTLTSGPLAGSTFEMSVIDNGEGSKASPDQRSLLFIGFSFTCADMIDHGMVDWEAGNVQVRGFNWP